MSLKVQRFFELNRAERSLFIQAFLLSIIYSFYILIVPKRIIFKWLGNKGVESSFEPISETLSEIFQVEKSIRRAVRYLPWKTKCFAQAISAKRLLQQKNISSTIYLGVAKKEKDRMIAHAWLRCGNRIVTGKEEMKNFTPVLCFS